MRQMSKHAMEVSVGRDCRKVMAPACVSVVLLLVCCASSAAALKMSVGGIKLVPQFGNFGPRGTLGMWQIPEGREPTRVMIIFKPKNFELYAFWDRSSKCLDCQGLPEKRKLVADALARNYAVFLPESIVLPDGDWGAWPPQDEDLLNVEAVISEWRWKMGFERLPMYGIGPSAGGHILSTLALKPGLFQGIAIIVSVGRAEAWEAVTPDYPQTIFVHMPKDTETAATVASIRKSLESKRVPVAEARWYEHALTPEWYSESILGVDLEMSKTIVDRIRDQGWLDDEDFLLEHHDGSVTWEILLYSWNLFHGQDPVKQHLIIDGAHEETEVAFAKHSTLARNDDQVFDFFEGGYKNVISTPMETEGHGTS